jgi:hypothetical protein
LVVEFSGITFCDNFYKRGMQFCKYPNIGAKLPMGRGYLAP